jgi:hypothetical protein
MGYNSPVISVKDKVYMDNVLFMPFCVVISLLEKSYLIISNPCHPRSIVFHPHSLFFIIIITSPALKSHIL